MSRGAHGSVTVTTVTCALSCLARASPCSRAFVASSEPSVAIRICLYIDGPRRSGHRDPHPVFFGPTPGVLASQTPAWRSLKISNITIQASGRVTGRGASLEGGQAYVAKERAI